jgi:subtilase family protein
MLCGATMRQYSERVRRLVMLIVALLAAGFGAAGAVADPNDPAWPDQWGPRLTRAADLWSVTTGDPRTVIAVVDTGLMPLPDLTHVTPGWDILGNDPVTDDLFGHGTWVSSVIGAADNNGIGIAGYCGQCSIMPVRVAAGHDGAIAPMITAGIRWAIDHGARIVNVSLASNQFDWNQAGVIGYAQEHGVLVVASAGNGGNTDYRYPAAYPGVVSVAGVDEQGQLDTWSTRGPWVTLAGPGCETVIELNNSPAYGCGSSFSPASVTGIAGLLLSLNPSLTVEQVTGALRSTAVPVPGNGGGRVDAWAAAHYLGLVPAQPAPAPAPAPPVPVPAATSRQVLLTDGEVRRRTTVVLSVSAGRLAVALTGPAAADCSLTFRVGGELYVGLAAERYVKSLAATVPTGRFPVTVACHTARRKAFEVSATGMFPN